MKTYDIENKIKSTKWNAFLLQQNEYEEYLTDGISVSESLFSRFSKAKKENDIRRNKRAEDLLNHRVSQTGGSNLTYNTYIPDITIEDTAKLSEFATSVSKKGREDSDPVDIKIQEFIKKGKELSGDIVTYYPVSVVYSTINLERENGVLFITTKGLSFVSTKKNNGSLQYLPYAVVSALGPIGAVAAGVGAIAGKIISDSVKNYKFSKEQQKIIEFAKVCSPCLFGALFAGDGQFIPYDIINALIYNIGSKEKNGFLTCIYRNIHMRVIFEMDQNIINEIIRELSGDTPPKYEK